jgi:hypothetical protein
MTARVSTHVVSIMALPALLLACDGGDPTGASGGTGSDRPTGNALLALSRTTGPSLAQAVAYSLMGNVPADAIASLSVTVTGLELIRDDGGEEDGNDEEGWLAFPLDAPATIDLLALPTDPNSPLTVPVVIEAGRYVNLRLVTSDATITFSQAFTIGGGPVARTYEPGTAYTLRIVGEPGGRLMVPGYQFTVAPEGTTELDLVFEEGTSVRSVVATPNFVQMAPVLVTSSSGDDE